MICKTCGKDREVFNFSVHKGCVGGMILLDANLVRNQCMTGHNNLMKIVC